MQHDPFRVPELLQAGADDGGSSAGEAVPVELVAGPFLHFGQVNAFLNGVRELPGVRGATLRRMHHGILSLVVDYRDDVPLEQRLAHLTRFPTHAEVRADRVVMITVPQAA